MRIADDENEEAAPSTSISAYDTLLTALAAPPGVEPSLVKINVFLYTVLTALTFSAFFTSRSDFERREILDKKEFAFELIIGWIVRLYNGKCWVLPIVILSLWLLHSVATKAIWGIGSNLRLLYSKQVTERIAVDLGNRVQSPGNFPIWASRKMILCVFHNCLVKFSTSYEGCKALGDGNYNYLFINFFTRPIPIADVPPDFDPSAGSQPSPAGKPTFLGCLSYLYRIFTIDASLAVLCPRCLSSRCYKPVHRSVPCKRPRGGNFQIRSVAFFN